jgi:hypothetical protein
VINALTDSSCGWNSCDLSFGTGRRGYYVLFPCCAVRPKPAQAQATRYLLALPVSDMPPVSHWTGICGRPSKARTERLSNLFRLSYAFCLVQPRDLARWAFGSRTDLRFDLHRIDNRSVTCFQPSRPDKLPAQQPGAFTKIQRQVLELLGNRHCQLKVASCTQRGRVSSRMQVDDQSKSASFDGSAHSVWFYLRANGLRSVMPAVLTHDVTTALREADELQMMCAESRTCFSEPVTRIVTLSFFFLKHEVVFDSEGSIYDKAVSRCRRFVRKLGAGPLRRPASAPALDLPRPPANPPRSERAP